MEDLIAAPSTNAYVWHLSSMRIYPGSVPYGTASEVGDVIGIKLDLDDGNGILEYTKNGESMGIAKTDVKTIVPGEVFPVVYVCKNCSCTANFGATPFAYPMPEEYQPYNGAQQTLQAPTNLEASAGDAQVSLSWTTVDGATNYKVKRSETAGGPYETVAESVYEPTYVNTGLINGTTYYYVVSATTANGESGNSNEVSATPQAGTTPPQPTGNGTLIVTVANNADREYNLTMAQIQEFIDWYNNRSTGGNVYTIEKTATSPYTRVKDYLIFDKIVAWQVKDY